MEPISLLAGYTQMVSLLADFKSSRGGRDIAHISDFAEWLVVHGHPELKELIERNAKVSIGIKAILHEEFNTLAGRLAEIDRQLAILSQGLSGFKELAAAFHPTAQLSEQQIFILKAFESAGASKATVVTMMGGRLFDLIDGQTARIKLPDPQFMGDDLDGLVGAGLLRISYNSSGKPEYQYTRSAKQLLEQLSEAE